MKKVLFLACLMALMIVPASAFAEGVTLDAGGLFATEPADGLGSEFGFRVGGSYDISEMVGAPVEVRADVSYIKWSEEESYTFLTSTATAEVEFRRIPIFLGARYNLPVDPVNVFFEAGLEVSLDKAEATATISDPILGTMTLSADESETNFGFTPGIGVSYPLSETVLVGANARYHVVSDSYFTFGLFLGVKL